MTKEELIQFLKENLTIEVTREYLGLDYEHEVIKVNITLDGEEITSDYDYLE